MAILVSWSIIDYLLASSISIKIKSTLQKSSIIDLWNYIDCNSNCIFSVRKANAKVCDTDVSYMDMAVLFSARCRNEDIKSLDFQSHKCSISSSIMYGVFSGVSETTLGLLLGNIPGLNVSSSLSVKGLFKEGLEEMLQEYVDAGLRATILDEKVDVTQLSKDALKSFLYGAIMSGVMNGGELVFTAITAKGSIKITSIQEAITFAKENGIEMLVYSNQEGIDAGINPFDHGSAYTDIMKTQALKQALNKYQFTAAFGGARRDEEKSRAKERIFSFRNEAQAWDPKNQRPEMWKLYNTKIHKGESMRVFPISNWTEKDIWQYIKRENIEIVPLYFAKERPVVYRDGNIIMVDDDRMKLREGEKVEMKKVRFRTLGCYPLTGGIESDAETLDEIIDETLSAVSSERTTRVIDHEEAGSMERRKMEGYF